MSVMTQQPGQRFRNSDVLRMFPSFVWKAELSPEVCKLINDSVLRALGEIGAPFADLKPGESWQSDQGLHELDQFREVVDCINEAAESVLDYLKVGHAGFKITGCWANVNAPGAGHRAHSHPNNYLSGVYYVRTHPDANTVNFLDPRPQTGIIRPPVTELTAENTEQVVVKVVDGTLLMFPAWLQHSVDPNRSGRTRISLGFNIMFSAYAETMAQPLWEPGRRPSI
ncbi:MAG TPA: 2OG-Fe(II) oxygenase family protein [Kiloniellales bacterium]